MMMNRRTVALLLTAPTVLAAPDIAAAQPAAPPEASASADAANRADALVQKAGRLYSDGQYQDAEALLLMAWELNPTFDVAYNLGNTKYQLKKYREAAQYLSFALRHWPLLKGVAKLKPNAEKWLAESRAQVGAVTVTVGAAGAEVLVDGKVVGRAPLEGEVFVEPGEHRIEARLSGYETASQTVKVAKGGAAKVELAMALAKSEAQTSGVKTEGGASAAGAGAPMAEQPPAGPVEPIAPPQQRSWVPVIALGAASAVGLGVGIGLTVASNNASADGRAQADAILKAGGGCPDAPVAYSQACADLRSTASRVDTFGRAATVAYAASGVLAIAAVTYALWPRSESRGSSKVRALPEARIGYGGIAVQGAW